MEVRGGDEVKGFTKTLQTAASEMHGCLLLQIL